MPWGTIGALYQWQKRSMELQREGVQTRGKGLTKAHWKLQRIEFLCCENQREKAKCVIDWIGGGGGNYGIGAAKGEGGKDLGPRMEGKKVVRSGCSQRDQGIGKTS